MSVSRLLVLKVRPAWTKSTATAAFVLRDTPGLAAKSVSATVPLKIQFLCQYLGNSNV